MSNTKTYGEQTFVKRKFLVLDHGDRLIMITAMETLPHHSIEVELETKEAKALAKDILKRVQELEQQLEEELSGDKKGWFG